MIPEKSQQRLRKLLQESPVTQQEMADKLEITRQYLNMVGQGKKPMTRKIASRLSRITGKPVRYWFGEDMQNEAQGTFVQDSLRTDMSAMSSIMSFAPRVLVDHEIELFLEDNYMRIDPWIADNIGPTCYELSIGNEFVSPREHLDFDNECIEYTVPPNSLCAVLTEEKIELPRNVSGSLSPSTYFVNMGLSILHGGLVHPGFQGRLFVVFKNDLDKEQRIDKGATFLHLSFHFHAVSPMRVYKGDNQGLERLPTKLVKNIVGMTATEHFLPPK